MNNRLLTSGVIKAIWKSGVAEDIRMVNINNVVIYSWDGPLYFVNSLDGKTRCYYHIMYYSKGSHFLSPPVRRTIEIND